MFQVIIVIIIIIVIVIVGTCNIILVAAYKILSLFHVPILKGKNLSDRVLENPIVTISVKKSV
jgi:hypothetical protein